MQHHRCCYASGEKGLRDQDVGRTCWTYPSCLRRAEVGLITTQLPTLFLSTRLPNYVAYSLAFPNSELANVSVIAEPNKKPSGVARRSKRVLALDLSLRSLAPTDERREVC